MRSVHVLAAVVTVNAFSKRRARYFLTELVIWTLGCFYSNKQRINPVIVVGHALAYHTGIIDVAVYVLLCAPDMLVARIGLAGVTLVAEAAVVVVLALSVSLLHVEKVHFERSLHTIGS